MMRFLETLWLVFFLLGLAALGVLGTWAETAPFWPGAALLAAAGAGSLLSRQSPSPQRISWICVAVTGLMALYLGWRAFTSEVRWMARQDLVFGGTALVAYLMMATRFTTDRARSAVLLVFFLLILGNTGLGLYQYFENPQFSVFSPWGLKRAAERSAGGFFESGNHLAGFLTLAGLPMLGATLMGHGMNPVIRVICGAGFLTAGVGVSFSTSRGGVVGFFAGMGILLLIASIFWVAEKRKGGPAARSRSRTGWLLLGSAVTFVALLVTAWMTLMKFFGNETVLKTLNGREVMWDAALEQWQSSPLIGTGARSYEYMERAYRTMQSKWAFWSGEMDAVYAHNDYLQCLGDYGLIGLGLVLLVVGTHVGSSLLQTLRCNSAPSGSRPEDRSSAGRSSMAAGLAAGGVAALAGGMVQALVEFNLHIGINAVMTGLVLGILATPGFLTPAASEASRNAGAAETWPHPSSMHARTGGPDATRPARFSPLRLCTGAIAAALSIILLESAWRLIPGDYAWRKARHELTSAVTLPELLTTSGTFQRATTLDPENCHAWYFRGLVSLQIASLTSERFSLPFYEAALAQLKRSLELYPQNPRAAAYAGSIAGHLGRLDEAGEFFRTALRWGVTIQPVNELYGDYLVRRKEYFEAVRFLMMSVHLTQDTEVRNSVMAKIQMVMERLKKQGLTPPPEAFLKPQE